MALSPFTIQDSGLQAILNGSIDLDTSALYAVLLVGAHTPTQNKALYSDISANEIADAGYVRQALTGAAIAASGKQRQFTSNPISFGSNVTLTAKYMYILRGTAASPVASDPILGWIDLNEVGGNISDITKANPGAVTSAGHLLTSADTIVINNSDMDEANRLYATVTVVNANTFTLGVDTTAAVYTGRGGRFTKLNNTTPATSNASSFTVTPQASSGWFLVP